MSYRVKVINPIAHHEWDREITFPGSDKDSVVKQARKYLRNRGDSVKNYEKHQPRYDIEVWQLDVPTPKVERREDTSDPLQFRAVKHHLPQGFHCWQIVSPKTGKSIYLHSAILSFSPRVDIREALESADQRTDALAQGTVQIFNDLYFEVYCPFEHHFLTKAAKMGAHQ